jgi:hypothetical protein
MSRRPTWWLAGVAAALIAAGISTWALAGTAADRSPDAAGAEPDHQFTGLAARVLTRPSAVRGTDGRVHIAYELVLTGATPLAVDVERVEVREATTHRVLLSLAGPDLVSRMNPVGDPPAGVPPDRPPPSPTATQLAPSGSAVVWLDVPVQRRADLPAVVDHLVVSSTRPPPGEQSIQFSSVVGRVAVGAQEPLELGPPVGGGLWVAAEGCCDAPSHHRRGLLAVDGDQVVPQRFAIDWMKLDERHRAWVGDPHRLSSYVSYGEPLLAAADGTVVVARDGAADAPPPDDPPPPSLAGLPGNHVILRVAPGVHLSYAHMRPGSVRVRVGERVRRGQVLGELGNTGASATPHLHFQVQVGRFFLTDGLPFVVDRFEFLGRITDTFWDGDLGQRPTGQLTFAQGPEPGARRLEMPLNNDVVRFPDPKPGSVARGGGP